MCLPLEAANILAVGRLQIAIDRIIIKHFDLMFFIDDLVLSLLGLKRMGIDNDNTRPYRQAKRRTNPRRLR